jgi:NAD(P)-dependent dehydrogenase (short-subunit alcohol dehydrogenase family)/acyl carrier protein
MNNIKPVEKRTMDNTTRQHLQTSLEAVRQGLMSISELQSKTAEAHQKFLDAQTQAGKTLLQIMQQTHQLSSAAMGIAVPLQTGIAEPVRYDPAPSIRPQYQDKPVQIASVQVEPSPVLMPVKEVDIDSLKSGRTPESEPKNPVIATPVSIPPAAAVAAVVLDTAKIQKTLLAVVSDLTGYPEEMLGLEMDIESDLGIDSIKRVEILSAFEEKMPDLPKVTPDMMGSLKTLGQICDYLGLSAETEPAPHTAAAADPGPEVIRRTLIDIVSDLTGYPEEMLGLEMDIESDLGIDSIKRVEILSAFEEKMPDLPKVTPDMMGSLKTLGQICDYLSGSSTVAVPSNHSIADADRGWHVAENEVDEPASTPLPRSVIGKKAMANRGKAPLEAAGASPVGIVCQNGNLAEALSKQLESYGFKSLLLSEPGDIASSGMLSGLLICAPVSPQRALEWVQAGQPALETKNSFIFTLSFIDGAFGFNGKAPADPHEGALAGLVKTAALEWPDVRCGAIDVNPEWDDIAQVGKAVATELVTPDPDTPLEIGLIGPNERIVLELAATPVAPEGPIDLNDQDVVVVTGGARGVTSACAIALARKTGCRVAMLGRSPEPDSEPEWLENAHSESDMKRVILEHQFKNKSASPKDIEAAYRKWKANREIRQSKAELAELGVSAQYFSVDVRDPDAVSSCLEKVRDALGAVKGLIHGAGVLEDRLIKDKQISQFQRVFETKVNGLESLLAATEKDHLKYLVCFSSIAARMGNIGQVDYAMANEVINKIAVKQQLNRPDCKVLSINWGPWDGGMVTPSLKRNFIKNDVSLIPIAQGTEAMLNEMSNSNDKEVEVVVGGFFHHPSVVESIVKREKHEIVETPPHASNGKAMSLTAKRDIDVENYPVLRSHLLNGKPVVPMALITEWLAHSALLANPGLVFNGIDDLRIYKGIILSRPKMNIRLMAGKVQKIDHRYEVDVEIRNSAADDREIIHSGAKAILSDRMPAPPEFHQNGQFKEKAIPFSLADAYKRILFHGEDLRGIKKIISISDQGMAAQLSSAPHPMLWVREPFRNHWIADPLVLDCAFQMAILWCYQQFEQVSLPSYAATYRQYSEKFPRSGVTAVLEVQNATDHRIVGCFTFLDTEKRVVARLDGYEAVMDQNLIYKFNPN